MDREEMAAWQYREETGYEREIGLTRSDFEDIDDPEFARHFADHVAAENKGIRERNDRRRQLEELDEANAKIETLTALLTQYGITIPEE